VAGDARLGGSGGQIFSVPLTRRARIASPAFSVCPASPERPLCSGDGLGTSDTVLGYVGKKKTLGTQLRTFFHPTRLNYLGNGLGDATGDGQLDCRRACGR
jgi:hypothetical protein